MAMRIARLTRKPFDKRDDADDYQAPPEDHKDPTKTAERSESKIHHVVIVKERRPASTRPPHIIFIIDIQPSLPAGNIADVSQLLTRLPIAICICSSPCSPIINFILSFMAICREVSPMD